MLATTTRHDTASPAELRRIIEMQQIQIEFLGYCRHFGVSTRQSLEYALQGASLAGYAIVFWDIDDLKGLNSRLGQPEANRRIGQVIKARAGDLLAGQWYSGDEFAAFVPLADAAGFAARLLAGLREIESSATIVIGAWRPGLATIAQVDALTEVCGAAKQRGERARVINLLRNVRHCPRCGVDRECDVAGGDLWCGVCGWRLT